MINTRILAATLVAIGTGLAIALQASLNGRAGGVIGPIRTGLLVNTAGGTIALVLVTLAALSGRFGVDVPVIVQRPVLPSLVGAGILGIVIIIGISYSVASIGVTAGLAAVIVSQLVVGAFLDQSALGAGVSIDLRRIMGILAMGVGVWLLLPRST
jgi:uncharacterized membrane protein YdcZ (DUF606 family)